MRPKLENMFESDAELTRKLRNDVVANSLRNIKIELELQDNYYQKMFVEIDGKYFLFLKNVVVAKDYIMWGWEVSDAIEADKSKLDDEGI